MSTNGNEAIPQVRFVPGQGWICSCTGVYVEHVDLSLDCHHWPLCEHLVKALRARMSDPDDARMKRD